MPKTSQPPAKALTIRSFSKPKEWSAWLAKHHAKSPGIWMKIAKKDSGIPTVYYPEALDTALCYGWIDGQKGKGGDLDWLQKFTPRAKRSIWSKINREKVLALIKSGKMKKPGLLEIERAKKDGRWEAAYDSMRSAVIPPDLKKALSQNPKAKAFYATLSSQNRYAILFRIHNVKRPETRARRIETFVKMLGKGGKIHP